MPLSTSISRLIPSRDGSSNRNLVDIFMGISEVVIKRQGMYQTKSCTNRSVAIPSLGWNAGRDRDTHAFNTGSEMLTRTRVCQS